MEIKRFFEYKGRRYSVVVRYIDRVEKMGDRYWSHHLYLVTLRRVGSRKYARYYFRAGMAYPIEPSEEHLNDALGCAFNDATYHGYSVEDIKQEFGYSCECEAMKVKRAIDRMFERLQRLGFAMAEIEEVASYYNETGYVPFKFFEEMIAYGKV